MINPEINYKRVTETAESNNGYFYFRLISLITIEKLIVKAATGPEHRMEQNTDFFSHW